MNSLEKIRKIVQDLAKEDDWKFHIIPVVNYSKQLAKALNADEEIAELAGLLHDIGRIKFGPENHEITGAEESEKLLKEHGYSKEIIEEIKHAIASHRGGKDIKPKTDIAKIVANADAMAHFDVLPYFFYFLSKKCSFNEAFEWVEEKLKRDWTKKLTLPVAIKIMEEKYKAIKIILESNRQYL